MLTQWLHLTTLKIFSNLKDSGSVTTLGRWHISEKKTKTISFFILREAGSSVAFPVLEMTRKDVKLLDMEQFEQETIYREQRVTALKYFVESHVYKCWLEFMTNVITSKILIRVSFLPNSNSTIPSYAHTRIFLYSPPRPFSVCIIFSLAKVAS